MAERKNRDLYLPSCWNDEVRMKALFSVFRNKDLNPTGWQEKMDFWIGAIAKYCQTMNCCVVSPHDVRMAFEKDKRYANCIDDVLNHMVNERLATTTEMFGNSKNSGWLSWGLNTFIKTPISWGYSTVKGMLIEPQKDSKLVIFEAVENLAKNILQKHSELFESDKIDDIVDLDSFRLQCADVCSFESFNLAIIQLEKEEHITLINENGKSFIKFKNEITDSSPSASECDTAVVKLRGSLQLLSNDIESLEKEVDSCTNIAKEFLREGSKSKAMCALKKRKRIEKELARKVTSADNLETLLSQLKNTASEKQVLQAYNAGVVAMKTCLTKDLDLNKVDSTMADLEEAADDFKELGNILSRGIADNHNDEELERELEDIMLEESEDQVANVSDDDDELVRRLHRLRSCSDDELSPVSKLHNLDREKSKKVTA